MINIFTSALYFIGNITLFNIIGKLYLLFKEYVFHRNHYPVEDRFASILYFTFSYNWKSSMIVLPMPLILGCLYMQDEDFPTNLMEHLYFSMIAALLYEFFGITECKMNLANFIRSGSGLDYATGMASNYFHGYLHLQLPDHGDNVKGITERMNDYESNEHVKFAIKKLFILIPHSLVTKPKICSNILAKAKPLETVVKGRAGVERPFKNDVYRFTKPINGQIYYIAVEGATPLLSFFEAMTNKLTGTPDMEEMHREILFQFYKSIKKYTKECAGTRNQVEIVYYQDVVNGRDVDVGQVLKHKIKTMLNIDDDDDDDSDDDFMS